MAAINYNITNDGTATITGLTFNFVTPSGVQVHADLSSIHSGGPNDFTGTVYSVTELNFLSQQVLTFSVNYSSEETGTYNGSISVTGTSASGEDVQLIPTEIDVIGSECLRSDICILEATETRIYYNVAWYPIVITQPNMNYFISLNKSDPDLDTKLFLYDSNGDYVDEDDDGGTGYLSQLLVSNLTPGTYYVGVLLYGDTDYDYDQFKLYSGIPLPTGCSIILDVCPPVPPPP